MFLISPGKVKKVILGLIVVVEGLPMLGELGGIAAIKVGGMVAWSSATFEDAS